MSLRSYHCRHLKPYPLGARRAAAVKLKLRLAHHEDLSLVPGTCSSKHLLLRNLSVCFVGWAARKQTVSFRPEADI